MRKGNKLKILQRTGFQSHNVMDTFQALYSTLNYDNQLTGNDEIHFHYETGMLRTYHDENATQKLNVKTKTDPLLYGFNSLTWHRLDLAANRVGKC
jgi:hypothetical protein